MMKVQFEKAVTADAEELAAVSAQAFAQDVAYGAPGPGGPPGYRSARWQARMMVLGDYYKVVENGRLVGGIILFRRGRGHYELGRIFIHPAWQNRGIGAQALCFIEQTYPHVCRWTLDTPAWNRRNQHFYEKWGYRRIGYNRYDGIRYEKRMSATASAADLSDRCQPLKIELGTIII